MKIMNSLTLQEGMTTLLFSAGRKSRSRCYREKTREKSDSFHEPSDRTALHFKLSGRSLREEGRVNVNRDGVCLETQFMPNAVNLEEKPQVILRKGGSYAVFTAFKFEVQEDD